MAKKSKAAEKTPEQLVREAQAEAGDDVVQMQSWIDSGTVWHLEGSMGREAMRLLEVGVCFLPEERHRDYWGNTVPARTDLQPGTKGTLENAVSHFGL
jgi:hypothetical protein